MALPKIVDKIVIKKWIPKLEKKHKCYLYDFKSMGITKKQFADVIVGRGAYIFEKPFTEKLKSIKCPWCEFKEIRGKRARSLSKKVGNRLQDHVFTHNKNLISSQVLKFQKELYTLRLQFVRQGYHECIAMLVEHECQLCINPRIKGRELMCSIPTATRNRMRSLKTLGYPIGHIINHPNREFEWSALGVIILIKSGLEAFP